MFFSAHFTNREPVYFESQTWPLAAAHAETLGSLLTLYWLADDVETAQRQLVEDLDP